jgi:hypothetical protein
MMAATWLVCSDPVIQSLKSLASSPTPWEVRTESHGLTRSVAGLEKRQPRIAIGALRLERSALRVVKLQHETGHISNPPRMP